MNKVTQNFSVSPYHLTGTQRSSWQHRLLGAQPHGRDCQDRSPASQGSYRPGTCPDQQHQVFFNSIKITQVLDNKLFQCQDCNRDSQLPREPRESVPDSRRGVEGGGPGGQRGLPGASPAEPGQQAGRQHHTRRQPDCPPHCGRKIVTVMFCAHCSPLYL